MPEKFRILDKLFGVIVAVVVLLVVLAMVVGSMFRDRRPRVYFAAEAGDTNYLAQYLSLGSNVNNVVTSYKNGYRWAPLLHIAVSGGHPDAVAFLLARGADVSATNDSGQTAIDLAGRHVEIEKLLLAAGATNTLAVLTNAPVTH